MGVTDEYDEKPKVASYWKTIALTASILMFVFLVLGIIASVVAVNQRKAINAQRDWDNIEARSNKAGAIKTLEHELEDISDKHAAGDITEKQKQNNISDKNREIDVAKEWTRCFDEDSATRDGKLAYCELKATLKDHELTTRFEGATKDQDQKNNTNAIA